MSHGTKKLMSQKRTVCDKRLWNLWYKSRVSLGLKNLTPNMKNILQHPPRSAMSDENEEDHRDTIHMNAAAPWQRSRCMLSWALCVSKFAVVSLHWDLWAVFRGFFCTIEMRAAPALPAILLASIASFSLALWQQLGCVCARAFCVPKNVRRRQKEDWDRQATEQQVCAQFSWLSLCQCEWTCMCICCKSHSVYLPSSLYL